MSLTAKNEGGERVIIPAGTHVARCYGIIDLGTQYSEKFGTWSHKVLFQWELPSELMSDGRPLAISKQYTISLNEKANLRRDLESWLGRSITAEEEHEGLALDSILGAPCLLSIVHSDSNGKTYANIGSVMSVPKGMVVPDAMNPMASYDIENGEDATYEALPEWIRTKIAASKEFKDPGEDPLPEPTDSDVPYSSLITEEQKQQINDLFKAKKMTGTGFTETYLKPLGLARASELTEDQAAAVIELLKVA